MPTSWHGINDDDDDDKISNKQILMKIKWQITSKQIDIIVEKKLEMN